jgi:hypothetical protein
MNTDTVEPTLLAMRAAAEAARTANHAAYHAPRTTSSVYDRVGALHDLLCKVEQLAGVLADDVGKLVEDSRLRSSERDDAATRARRARERLVDATWCVKQATDGVNDAWSDLSALYLAEETR